MNVFCYGLFVLCVYGLFRFVVLLFVCIVCVRCRCLFVIFCFMCYRGCVRMFVCVGIVCFVCLVSLHVLDCVGYSFVVCLLRFMFVVYCVVCLYCVCVCLLYV